MRGIDEQNLALRCKINTLLDNRPEYLKGFINFMNDSSIRTKYNYLVIVLRFINIITKDPSQYTFEDFNNYLADAKYKENGEALFM